MPNLSIYVNDDLQQMLQAAIAKARQRPGIENKNQALAYFLALGMSLDDETVDLDNLLADRRRLKAA